jgi:hypothetical protein
MATKTTDQRLEEMHERIDRLQEKAEASGAGAKGSIKTQLDALRQQEESARAAVKEAHEVKKQEASERAAAADDKLSELETRARSAESALAAELAEDKKTFVDAINADLEGLNALFHRLDEKAATKTGAAREHAEAAISDLRRSRDTLAERLTEVRDASGDRWRERKKDVIDARTKLDRKVDDVWKKLQ